MDGAQEVERNRTAQAVSAKVHTRARRRVSFGEPEDNTGVRSEAAVLRRLRWTKGCADRFAAGQRTGDFVRIDGVFKFVHGAGRERIDSRQTGQTVVEMAMLLPLLLL